MLPPQTLKAHQSKSKKKTEAYQGRAPQGPIPYPTRALWGTLLELSWERGVHTLGDYTSDFTLKIIYLQ